MMNQPQRAPADPTWSKYHANRHHFACRTYNYAQAKAAMDDTPLECLIPILDNPKGQPFAQTYKKFKISADGQLD